MIDLRFRAWHIKDKRMFKVDKLIWKYGHVYLISEYTNKGTTSHHYNSVIIFQSTGLSDKYRSLIHVGDILKHSKYGYGEVVWKGCIYRSTSNNYDAPLTKHYLDDSEIAGDIFNNLDLLLTPELIKYGIGNQLK